MNNTDRPLPFRFLQQALAVLVGSLLISGIALAEQPRPGRSVSANTSTKLETAMVTPGLSAPRPAAPVPAYIPESEVRAQAARLHVDPELILAGLKALDDVYNRHYREAKDRFMQLTRDYPGSAVGPLGMVVLAQARMSENLDFSQEPAYNMALKETLHRASDALDRGEAPAWNRFLRATARGMNGIYEYRKSHYLGAIQDGYTALSDLEQAKKLEPSFVDPDLGLGIYNYWRTALTKRYWYLPKFADKRAEGIAQLERARDHGLISPTFARLALAFTWWEDGKPAKAVVPAEELYVRFPTNIINLQLLGQLQARLRRFEDAQRSFLQVLEADPRNIQVNYYLGNLELYRYHDAAKARAYLTKFVDANPENSYVALGMLRLGDACFQMGDLPAATKHWTIASKRPEPEHRYAEARLKGNRPGRRVVALPVQLPSQKPRVTIKGAPPTPPSPRVGTPLTVGSAPGKSTP